MPDVGCFWFCFCFFFGCSLHFLNCICCGVLSRVSTPLLTTFRLRFGAGGVGACEEGVGVGEGEAAPAGDRVPEFTLLIACGMTIGHRLRVLDVCAIHL